MTSFVSQTIHLPKKRGARIVSYLIVNSMKWIVMCDMECVVYWRCIYIEIGVDSFDVPSEFYYTLQAVHNMCL